MAEGVKCGNCGAPVHGPPGVMACPYCGFRVDMPMTAPEPRRMLPEEDPEERARARRHDSYEEDDEGESRTESSSNTGAIVGAAVAVGLLAVVMGAVFSRSHKKTSKDERKSAAIATTTTSKRTASPPPYVESVAIPSCKCAFGDGQSTPLITLSLKAPPTSDATRTMQLGISRQSGFVTETTTANLATYSTVLGPTDGGVPPQHLGVACDTGIYVLVGDKTATGWSSVNAAWKWTTALPAAMVDGDAGVPASARNTSFSSYCTPLATQNGSATIALANGRRATLSLKDGKLR